VAWFVVAPTQMLVGLLFNGVWGLGTGFGLALFGRPRVPV